MPLPRHPDARRPAALLCLAGLPLLAACGGEDPATGLEDATGDLVEATRERFEASAEYQDAQREAASAATGLDAKLGAAAPAMEAGIEEDLAAADAGLDEARAALGRQADDLFEEIDAAIADRRYPQAQAALETLKRLPDANPDAAPDLAERIEAIEASLGEARRAEETLGSARAAIDAAKNRPEQTPGGEAAEVGSEPVDAGPSFEK